VNPYLKAKRAQYEQLRSSIQSIQTRAAEHKNDDGSTGRSLSDTETELIRSQGEQGEKLYAEIVTLTEIEGRDAKVAELTRSLSDDGTGDDGDKTRSLGSSSTTAQDRDPGHYRSVKDGGQQSFFADLYRAKTGEETSQRRLTEHQRALTTGGEGVGIVPPKWLSEEFETLARQGRRLSSAVRTIPLGDDPRPITLPRQTVGTDAVVAEQAAENNPVGGADAWDSDVHVVAPKPTAGKQTFSRQMFDMSSPAIDQLVYGDLIEVFDDKVELKVGAAVVAAAGAAVTTLATEAAFDAAGAASDSVVDAAIAVRQARKRPGDILWMTVRRWGEFLKLKDTTGRPLIPLETAGPMNVIGVGSVAVDGRIHGLGVVATDGVGTTAYPESYGVMRAMDTVLFESNMLRFRFEEVAGPESIVLGIWGYTAVIVRQTPGAIGTQSKSVRRVQVTAA
jgi:HK97 family phage major capsid protein